MFTFNPGELWKHRHTGVLVTALELVDAPLSMNGMRHSMGVLFEHASGYKSVLPHPEFSIQFERLGVPQSTPAHAPSDGCVQLREQVEALAHRVSDLEHDVTGADVFFDEDGMPHEVHEIVLDKPLSKEESARLYARGIRDSLKTPRLNYRIQFAEGSTLGMTGVDEYAMPRVMWPASAWSGEPVGRDGVIDLSKLWAQMDSYDLKFEGVVEPGSHEGEEQ